MTVAGYVPFYNNAPLVLGAIESLRAQQPALSDIVAIDDGSTDGGGALLERAGVRVIRIPRNSGRGLARARAMAETRGEFVLSVDATKALPPDFLRRSLDHMAANPRVAAVNGRNWQEQSNRLAHRWRARHLFKMDAVLRLTLNSNLNTNGTLLRRSAVESVGGFNANLPHSEDMELGLRLRAAGWKIIMDPSLLVIERSDNTLGQVLRRHWRYHLDVNERFSFKWWSLMTRQAWRVMAPMDWRNRDPACLAVTMYYPLHLLGLSLMHQRERSRIRLSAQFSASP